MGISVSIYLSIIYYLSIDASSTLYFGVTSIGLDLHVAWFGVIIVGPFLVSVSRAARDILWIDCLEKSFFIDVSLSN